MASEVGDLFETIEKAQVECLNESSTNTIAAIFPREDGAAGGWLESDADEQLLMNVPFRMQTAIREIVFSAPADDSRPSEVRLYVNPCALSFDNVDILAPAQMEELKWEGSDGDNLTATLQL
eukprot:gene3703-14264_t